jgi:hypothetical protein
MVSVDIPRLARLLDRHHPFSGTLMPMDSFPLTLVPASDSPLLRWSELSVSSACLCSGSILAAEEAIDIPCNACEVCSIGYRSASWLPSVGSRAYNVNDIVERSVVKCDLNLYHQHLESHLRESREDLYTYLSLI